MVVERSDNVAESPTCSPLKASLDNVDSCYGRSLVLKSYFNPRRVIRQGADKLNKTMRNVRATFGYLSQHIRGRRQHRLTDSQHNTPSTPQRKKKVLGRSPTKLYSPFGIETPHYNDCGMTPYMPDTPDKRSSPVKVSKKTSSSWRILSKKRPRVLFN